MEAEGARLSQELHICKFVKELVALSAIAVMAAGYKVLPCGCTSTRAWKNMVEGEFAAGEDKAAVLAGTPIAEDDVLARECAALMRDAAVLEEANY